MFEVVPHGNGFGWRFISAEGRELVPVREMFPCDREAGEAAKRYRTAFFAHACRVDHRMGACI